MDPPQLMFGPDDWETPKTVRIRGVDDGVGDGDQAFTISFVVVSEDHAYEGLAVDPLHALNREVPSVVVGDPTPLFTTEDGATARFEIRLAAPPTANVVIDVQVSDGSEISAAPSSLTFSPSNWSTSVAVTLTGLDDALFDGDQRLQIQFTVSSADARYEKLSVEPIPMANFDDEPTVVSVSTSGAPGDNGGSEGYSISDDGRLIAFISGSTNLVPDDTNGTDDVFVHDRLTGQTSRVSMTVEGQQLASDAFYPTISGDGMHVIYTTRRDPAVPKVHLYVHHRATGKTELVSGEFDYAYSGGPSDLSDDGRFVAFVSPPTPGWWMSVHVRDMQTGVVTLVSHRLDGSPNTAAAMWPRIKAPASRSCTTRRT